MDRSGWLYQNWTRNDFFWTLISMFVSSIYSRWEFSVLDMGLSDFYSYFFFTTLLSWQNYKYLCLCLPSSFSHVHCPCLPTLGAVSTNRVRSPLESYSSKPFISHLNNTLSSIQKRANYNRAGISEYFPLKFFFLFVR